MDAGFFVAEDEVVQEFRWVGVFLVGGGFGGGWCRFGVRIGGVLVTIVCALLTAESSLVVCDALVDGCADVDLVIVLVRVLLAGCSGAGGGEHSIAYHATCCSQCLRLTPQLITVSFDVVHSVENHEAVFAERALRPRICHAPCLLFCAGMVVNGSRMGGIMSRHNVDLVAGFRGGESAGVEELGLGLFELRRELVGAVGEAGAGVAGQYYEL